LEHLHMIAGPRPRGSLFQLIRRALGQAILCEEPSVILDLVLRGRSVCC
jgi:hypothetical protein